MPELENSKINYTFRKQKKGARKKLFENPIILVVPPMFASAHVWADNL